MLNAMGLGFCESGGVRFLLNLSLQGSNLDRSSRSVNQKRKAEAQYAFRALGACLDACEHNKKFIEDEIGFVELANLLNSSEIDLFEQEFDVILNLGMTTTENHLGRPYFNTKLSPNVVAFHCRYRYFRRYVAYFFLKRFGTNHLRTNYLYVEN